MPATTSVPSFADSSRRLRTKMLAVGWSPDDIKLVQNALVTVKLHDTYLQAGYSPEEISKITSLY
jgi:hypothetical protein